MEEDTPKPHRFWRPRFGPRSLLIVLVTVVVASVGSSAAPALAQSKSYRLPSVDLKQPIIWGSECVSPDGFGLAFGGQDQVSDDGQPHTRILVDGKWVAIHRKLRQRNPFQNHHNSYQRLCNRVVSTNVQLRSFYFQGSDSVQSDTKVADGVQSLRQVIIDDAHGLIEALLDDWCGKDPYRAMAAAKQLKYCINWLTTVEPLFHPASLGSGSRIKAVLDIRKLTIRSFENGWEELSEDERHGVIAAIRQLESNLFRVATIKNVRNRIPSNDASRQRLDLEPTQSIHELNQSIHGLNQSIHYLFDQQWSKLSASGRQLKYALKLLAVTAAYLNGGISSDMDHQMTIVEFRQSIDSVFDKQWYDLSSEDRLLAMMSAGTITSRLIPYADSRNLMQSITEEAHSSIDRLKTDLPHEERLAVRASIETKLVILKWLASAAAERPSDDSRNSVQSMTRDAIFVVQLTETLDAEPAPRALSPLVFDPKSKVFVLFGGDHLDYLTNDTWVFDPAVKQWERRWPKSAPPPRANHAWKALGDGKLVLSGGYTYTSNTDYVGGQYQDIGDGEWTYDVEGNTWSRSKDTNNPTGAITFSGIDSLAGDERTYRTGSFDPNWFLAESDPPDRTRIAYRLSNLPPNKWVPMYPPRLPRLNRDWGTAIIDPKRDLILRYSGGHSAHGGTDVLHYHLATNRWELTMPVEFPLGQLYTNTEYPDGFNFNLRPWITGHTYQSYGYDPLSHKMLFTGRPRHTYFYDPDRGDWSGRFTKPDSMSYDSCFYTLTLCTTPTALFAWTQGGELLRFDLDGPAWRPVKLRGEELPGSVVDNSTLTYDSERHRLLFVRKEYGENATFDGQIYVVDLETSQVSKLSPKNSEHASKIPYLCQLRYDPANDLALVGGTLPPDDKGLRRTPAYDCLTNAWISLSIGGIDPSDPKGRNVSLGMVYDPRRNLFWAVDTDSEVYVLRLSAGFAERQPLR